MDKLTSYLQGKRGRLTELAASLGVTPAAIGQWKVVPADRVVAIESATGIPRSDLRPDLFEGYAAPATTTKNGEAA